MFFRITHWAHHVYGVWQYCNHLPSGTHIFYTHTHFAHIVCAYTIFFRLPFSTATASNSGCCVCVCVCLEWTKPRARKSLRLTRSYVHFTELFRFEILCARVTTNAPGHSGWLSSVEHTTEGITWREPEFLTRYCNWPVFDFAQIFLDCGTFLGCKFNFLNLKLILLILLLIEMAIFESLGNEIFLFINLSFF